MWLHVLVLTSLKLKWYFDHDQFTATIIFFMLGLGKVCNEDFLDSVKDVPVLSIHHFLSALVKLDKCKSKHNVTLFSLRHGNHFVCVIYYCIWQNQRHKSYP